MLRPALDHNIDGVLESLPSVGIKLLIHCPELYEEALS